MKTTSFFIFGLVFTLTTPFAFAEYEDTVVVLETNAGDITIEFFSNDAPNHVRNFIELAESGHYDDTLFHRIIKDFMIQGGDPLTKTNAYKSVNEWGTGGPDYSINAEFNDIMHNRGIVSMARSADPNSAGSQFFILHADSNHLDGEYTVFGRIATQESFDTLDIIANLETVQGGTIPVDLSAAYIGKAEVRNKAEISDLLNLGPPERTTKTIIQPPEISQEKYLNQDLGFSFTSPSGWQLSEPERIDDTTPVVVAIGPKQGGFNPHFSVAVGQSEMSFEQSIQAFVNQLQPLIEAGNLDIVEQKSGNIKGHEAYILSVTGKYRPTADEVIDLAFVTVIMKHEYRIFSLQYTDHLSNFDSLEGKMIDVVETFEILPVSSPQSIQNLSELDLENSEGGGCLIATAAYGSEMAPQVQFLREIRDGKVMATQSGTAFMTGFNQFYYSFSPAVADYERDNPVFKESVKLALTPMLTSLALLNYVDVDTEEQMLGWGISLILLNIGMYFVAPAAVIIALKNRRSHQTSSTSSSSL